MSECNPVHTTGAGAELSLKKPDTMLLDSTGIQFYQVITGSLMFLSQCTRYDITYAANQLARAMSKPSELHMTAAKHLLRYLKAGMGLAITDKTGCFEMTGYCDVSWGSNPDNGKSTSGYLFMLAGGPPSFKTALQNVTAQSTLEAALISMAHESKEGVYLSKMMAALGFGKLFESVPLFGDNTEALDIAGNSTYSSRTKHIALRFFCLKELVKDGEITIHHVATQKQLVDARTKFLTKNTHRHLLNLIEAYTTRNGT